MDSTPKNQVKTNKRKNSREEMSQYYVKNYQATHTRKGDDYNYKNQYANEYYSNDSTTTSSGDEYQYKNNKNISSNINNNRYQE